LIDNRPTAYNELRNAQLEQQKKLAGMLAKSVMPHPLAAMVKSSR